MGDETDIPDSVRILISALLDEVYRLRKAMAYEALETKKDLELKTLPKEAKGRAVSQIARMVNAARGKADRVYHWQLVDLGQWERALETAGAKPTLTRWEFEKSIGLETYGGAPQ